MKKSNIFLLILIIIFANACNKESVIEGTVVNPTVVSLNKTVSLYTTSVTPISLNVGGNIVSWQTQLFSFKAAAGSTNVTSTNDSVRFNSIYTSTSTFSVNGTAGTNGLAVITKFNKGEEIPIGSGYTGNLYFVISKKSSPYTSPYTSINSNIIISGGGSFTPQFSLNNDGYIVFKYSTYGVTPIVNYYGWIHVIISQNEVTFDKYAYQKYFPIKVGQEE